MYNGGSVWCFILIAFYYSIATGDVSRSFPLQFGSISPGVMNGMQVLILLYVSFVDDTILLLHVGVFFFFFFTCEANFLVVLILLNKTIAPAVCYCRYLLGLAPLLQIWMSRNVTRFVAANKDKWLLSYCYYDAFVL